MGTLRKNKLPSRDLSRWLNRVAWNVLAARRRHRISQMQLAVLADVGLNTVLRLENGDSNITIDTLQRICAVLQLKFPDIVELPEWAVGRVDPARMGIPDSDGGGSGPAVH